MSVSVTDQFAPSLPPSPAAPGRGGHGDALVLGGALAEDGLLHLDLRVKHNVDEAELTSLFLQDQETVQSTRKMFVRGCEKFLPALA